MLQIELLLVQLREVDHHDLRRIIHNLFSVVIPRQWLDEIKRMPRIRRPETKDPVHLNRHILDLVRKLSILRSRLLLNQHIHPVQLLLMLFTLHNRSVFFHFLLLNDDFVRLLQILGDVDLLVKAFLGLFLFLGDKVLFENAEEFVAFFGLVAEFLELSDIHSFLAGEVGGDEFVDLLAVEFAFYLVYFEDTVQTAVYHELNINQRKRIKLVKIEQVK